LRAQPGGWRDTVSRLIRDHSSYRGARSLHALSLHASGFGTAYLPVGRSGERHVLELLSGVPRPTIFDVGAFEGDYAVLARGLLGPGADLHCFEPGTFGLARLKARAGEAALQVHEMAITATTGEATLHQDPDVPTMASLHPSTLAAVDRIASRHTQVRASSLDDFCEQHAIARVDLLKLDTEGTELDVLRGASRLLADRALGIIQFEFGYGNIATRTFIRDFYDLLGPAYDIYRVTPRGLIPLGPYELALEVFADATNYAAIPGP
jgi:FkbM family methyltransferase